MRRILAIVPTRCSVTVDKIPLGQKAAVFLCLQ
jgi:hypothetical protein